MNNICDDILVYISKFLFDKDTLMFLLTSKYIKNLFYKRGYLKKICFNHIHNPFIFSNCFIKHYNTLKNVRINGLTNPHYFMFGIWPNNIHFYNCFIDETLSPFLNTKTLELKILYNLDFKLTPNFNINWNKLYLDLNSSNINFLNDIDICQELEIVCLILNKNFEIPNIIGNLKNLKYFITNCDINVNTFFISKDLKHCISKNMNSNNFTKNNIIKDRAKYLYNERLLFSDLMNYINYV